MGKETAFTEAGVNYGEMFQPQRVIKVIKKDGSLEAFNVQKVIDAVGKSAYRALTKFTEEENYYKDIENPHFEFIIEYLENEDFYKDFKIYAKSIFDELKYKEAQRPVIEAQKAKAKEFRKKVQDYKMSKLKPTKKQLYYYEKVARAHGVKINEVENATRLDLRNWIMEIIDPAPENPEGEA